MGIREETGCLGNEWVHDGGFGLRKREREGR